MVSLVHYFSDIDSLHVGKNLLSAMTHCDGTSLELQFDQRSAPLGNPSHVRPNHSIATSENWTEHLYNQGEHHILLQYRHHTMPSVSFERLIWHDRNDKTYFTSATLS
jgi:hypothetical protein